jgi:hypothetical protein
MEKIQCKVNFRATLSSSECPSAHRRANAEMLRVLKRWAGDRKPKIAEHLCGES